MSLESIINLAWMIVAAPIWHLYIRQTRLEDRAQDETAELHKRINAARDDMTSSELRILREHATKNELESGFAKMDQTITLLRDDQKATSKAISDALQRIEDKLERKADK